MPDTGKATFRLGVMRRVFTEDGEHSFLVSRSADCLKVELPTDGSEFLTYIYLDDEQGQRLLYLPLALAPAAQEYAALGSLLDPF